MFSPTSLRNKVIEVSKKLTRIDAKTELDEFRTMLIVHVCALSHTILKPSPKLLNLFYPIPKMGSYNNLLLCGVMEDEHDTTLTRLTEHFGLSDFGKNCGENLCCEGQTNSRVVVDVFIKYQTNYLLNSVGQSMANEYGSDCWTRVLFKEFEEL